MNRDIWRIGDLVIDCQIEITESLNHQMLQFKDCVRHSSCFAQPVVWASKPINCKNA